MSIAGKWYNELGSTMVLDVEPGGFIKGPYETAVGDAQGVYSLTGWVDPDVGPTGSTAIAFTVLWNNQSGNSHSVTGWSGQYQVVNGTECILTHWLLTSETDPSDSWQSTLIGSDTFLRQPPSAERTALRRAAGPASHPRPRARS